MSRSGKRRLLLFVTCTAAAAVLAGFAVRAAAPAVARFLIVQDPLRKADAILVLGSQRMTRTVEAGALHRDGWARTIILTPNDSPELERIFAELGLNIPRFSDLQIDALVQMGVPPGDIRMLEGNPASTLDEAELMADLARKRDWSRVIVVTTAYHTRRARCYFDREETAELDFVIRDSRFETVHPRRWWRVPGERLDVTLEYVKFSKFLLAQNPLFRSRRTPDRSR
ncbi:MAG: YdcF family protein [Thermoanaerobaculia bacterium]